MQPKTILVTGSTGQLGRSLQKIAADYPQFEFTFAGRKSIDLSDSASIENYFLNKSFDFIINAAAYTAVDKAESEPELADQINHLAVKQIAEISKEKDIVLIHISTDYVFNGKSSKPYTEEDVPDPINVYGITKYKGELAIKRVHPAGCVIRTSWLYSEFGHNFIKTMLKLGQEHDVLNVVSDQVGSPTYATDLARATMYMIKQLEKEGKNIENEIYHFSNDGGCSWYDFAKAIFELNDVQCVVRAIETKDYPTPASRPGYSLMDKTKIKSAICVDMLHWKDSLRMCLKRNNKAFK